MILLQKSTGESATLGSVKSVFKSGFGNIIFSLSEMVVHIDKINEIITAYIEHEFQERT